MKRFLGNSRSRLRRIPTPYGAHDGKPLYSKLDALNSLDSFGRTAAYSEVLEISPGVSASFIDAAAKRAFLVHGEQDTMSQFAARLGAAHVELPEPKQVFEL